MNIDTESHIFDSLGRPMEKLEVAPPDWKEQSAKVVQKFKKSIEQQFYKRSLSKTQIVFYDPKKQIAIIHLPTFEPIEFSGSRARVIEFLYKKRGGEWYDSTDFEILKASQLNKIIEYINRRVDRHTQYKIDRLIEIKEKINKDSRQRNKYRWGI